MMRHFLFLILLSFAITANAGKCYESSIQKPAPFMGNDGEIFKLADGSLWEVKYEYEYMYEYYPDVIIPQTVKVDQYRFEAPEKAFRQQGWGKKAWVHLSKWETRPKRKFYDNPPEKR